MEDKDQNIQLNENKWDKRADTFEKKRFKFNFFQFLQKRVIALLDLREGQHFLDVGCGTGWAVRYAASLVNNRGEFDGIDISPRMIQKAIEYSENCENIHFYKANAENLPFQNNFFDFTICTNSFHHYINPPAVLTEINRVLKPQGKLFILEVTTDNPIVRLIDKYLLNKDPSHVKMYSTREYKEMFTKTGFTHVSSKLLVPLILSMKVQIAVKS